MGPKIYEYRVIAIEGENTVYEVRGITLLYDASQLVNFEVMQGMIFGRDEPTVNVQSERKLKRKMKADGKVAIVTEPADKRYRISFKRWRMEDNTSVPFGYM